MTDFPIIPSSKPSNNDDYNLISDNREAPEPGNELIPDEKKKNNDLDINTPTFTLSRKVRWFIFFALAFISTFSNLDGGIIPAATETMKEIMKVGEAEIGLFGSMDYLGRIIGSLVFITLINTVNRRFILIGTLFIKGLSLFIPFFSKYNYYLNLSARAISGFSQVYYTIYLPVWCDQYGPKKHKTIMITIIQLGTPLGIVLGFGLCTLIGKTIWEYSFGIEGIILGAMGILLIFFPQLYFSNTLMLIDGSNVEVREMPNIDEEEEQEEEKKEIQETIKVDDQKSPTSVFREGKVKKKRKFKLFRNIKDIICEFVFLFTGLSNSVVFFGMAVIQFWGANFMEKVLGEKSELILLYVFSAICITGPPAGVILGGVVGSKIGGYTTRKAILYCVGFCAISCIFAMIVTVYSNVYYFGSMVWLYFLFSSAMIPLETGIIISSLPERLRGDGFSVMNFFLNLIGNLPASSVYGLIFENTKDTQPSLAMFLTMAYNLVGLLFVILGAVFRLRKKDKDTIIAKEEEKTKKEQTSPAETTIGDNISKIYGAYGNPKEAIKDTDSDPSPLSKYNEGTL